MLYMVIFLTSELYEKLLSIFVKKKERDKEKTQVSNITSPLIYILVNARRGLTGIGKKKKGIHEDLIIK